MANFRSIGGQYTTWGGGTGNLDLSTEGSYYDEIIGSIVVNNARKIIHRRTVYFGVLPNNTAKNVPHSLPVSGIKVITLHGTEIHSNGIVAPLPNIYVADSQYNIDLYMDTTNITVTTKTTRSSFVGIITIEYYEE